jgi:hypothetical protein
MEDVKTVATDDKNPKVFSQPFYKDSVILFQE